MAVLRRRRPGNGSHLLDAVCLAQADDTAQVTARQLRNVGTRSVTTGRWQPGDPELLIVMGSGYDIAYLSHILADLPMVLVGRQRSDRLMLRDADPARSGPRGGWTRRHGGSSPSPSSTPGTPRPLPSTCWGTTSSARC
ncbi:transposase [Streptomyces tibetensis]|uniref:transposase n=1 Tax=Streptomyces tibetensis TaxID=2382123 RepID=UPI0033C2F050